MFGPRFECRRCGRTHRRHRRGGERFCCRLSSGRGVPCLPAAGGAWGCDLLRIRLEPLPRLASDSLISFPFNPLTLVQSLQRMSSKKRRGDSPARATTELSNAGSPDLASAHPDPSTIDDSDWKKEAIALRAQLDEARAEIERMRAAAQPQPPCPRCDFHADWTVRVRTMAGQVHTVACPDGPKTRIAHVKQQLVQFDIKWFVQEPLTLVLPCETFGDSSSSGSSSSSDGIDQTDPALVDDRTLASYGVSSGDLLDLLVVDINWSEHSAAFIERIRLCGSEMTYHDDTPIRDDDGSLALVWALVNAVRFQV
jgi:hypothetical protein